MARLGVSAKALSDRIRQLRVQLDLSASEADDGLLTASEISLLKIGEGNAGWAQ